MRARLLLLIAICLWSGPRLVSADANETAVDGVNALHQSAITAGGYHTCALQSTGAMKCWGFNGSGQLGDSSTTQSLIPTQVTGLTSGVTAITGGSGHTCALLSTGAVKCWGFNAYGGIGDNTNTNRSTPTQVTGLTSGVTAITAGFQFSCALLSTGAAKCWGANGYRLGDNTTTDRWTPTQVDGLTSGVTAITAGNYHACALLSTGAAKCWGDNRLFALGDNTTTNRSTPTQVDGLTSGVTAITAGGMHTCALLSSGAVKCWGYNLGGRVGDNTSVNRSTPTQVNGLTSGVTAITAGNEHTCALLSTGAVKCWGQNDYGQLGDNSTTHRWTPTQVSGLTSGVTAIRAGGAHTCALLSTGALKCWGYNGDGRLGDNSTTNRLIPTQVNSFTSGVGPTTTTTTTTTAPPTTTVAPTTTTTTTAPATTTSTSTTVATTTTTMPASSSTSTSTTPVAAATTAPPASSPTSSSIETFITAPAGTSGGSTDQTSTTTSSPSGSSPSPSPATTSVTAALPTTTSTSPESAPAIEEFLGASPEDISELVNQASSARGAALLVNGRPASVDVTTTTKSTMLTFGLASLEVTCYGTDGQPIALSDEGRFTLQQGDSIAITATGFAPGSRINAAVFSDPVVLGTATTDGKGRAGQRWAVPDTIEPGDHTLVLSGDLAEVKNSVFGLRIIVDEQSLVTRLWSSAWARVFLALGVLGGVLLPANRRRRRAA